MLGRFLDDGDPPEVRQHLTTVTLARLGANALYRYSAPFLATIADGLDVSLSEVGAAVTVTEAVGLTAPLLGAQIDRRHHPTTMVIGLVGITAGAIVVATSPNILWFIAGLVLLAVAKILFDVALGAWTASQVPYERRGRVVGLVETSWAGGMLVGVSVMGLVTAVSSWRWGYVTGAVMTAAAVVAIAMRLGRVDGRLRGGNDRMPVTTAAGEQAPPGRSIGRRGWWVVGAMFSLSAAAQALFYTFGAWLEDDFGYGAAALSAITFGIGGLELVASTTSAARVDRWGKERSVIAGAGVMLPTALLLAGLHDIVAVGLICLALFIAAFEFSIVSSISIAGDLVPGAPARGLATVIAAATAARATTVLPATWLYERRGIWAPALLGAALAVVTATCVAKSLAAAGDD